MGGATLVDVTHPEHPRVLAARVGDLSPANPDVPTPELPAQTGARMAPEGNGHEAEFTKDNRSIVAAAEDFNPNAVLGSTDDGGSFKATPGAQGR